MADVYEVPTTNNNDDNVDEYDSETIDEEMLDEIMLDLHDNEIIQNILSPTNDLEGQVNEAEEEVVLEKEAQKLTTVDVNENENIKEGTNIQDINVHDSSIKYSNKQAPTSTTRNNNIEAQLSNQTSIKPSPQRTPLKPNFAASPMEPEWIEYFSSLQHHCNQDGGGGGDDDDNSNNNNLDNTNNNNNKKNEQVYKMYRNHLKGNKKFIDTNFPSNIASITGRKNNNNGIKSTRKRMSWFSEHIKEDQVQWLRIPDIVENVSYIRFTWHRNLNKLDSSIFTNLLHATTADNAMRISGISTMTLKEVEYKKQCFAMDESWTSVRHAYMDTAKAAALSGMVGQISGCSKLFDNELKTWCLDKHGNNKNTNGYNFFDNIKNKAFPCKFERDITVAYFYAEYPMNRENPQLSGEYANGLHVPSIDDEAIVHVICAVHFNAGPKCLFAKEYDNNNMAEFFENDQYKNDFFDKENPFFDALGCLVTAGTEATRENNHEDTDVNDKTHHQGNSIKTYHSISKQLFPKIFQYQDKMKVMIDQELNDNGIYLVELYYNNEKNVVIIDDQIPCDNFGMPLFTKPLKPLQERKLKSYLNPSLPCPTEYWPLLIEKAYAKLHGSYYNMRFNVETQSEMDYLRSQSSLLITNNNVGNKNKMTQLCKSLNSLTGGVSTTFQWNLKTGRGYRDGILDWFIPPSKRKTNTDESPRRRAASLDSTTPTKRSPTRSRAGTLDSIVETNDDSDDAMDSSMNVSDLNLDDNSFYNESIEDERHEEAAKTLFRRLRTIAIGEENKDTIFIVKKRNDDEDEDVEELDTYDTNVYIATNILNKDRDSLTWILDDPSTLNSRQSFVTKLSSPMTTLVRPWNLIKPVDDKPKQGDKNIDDLNQPMHISMTELYKNFRAITVHHTCNNRLLSTASSSKKNPFKYHLNITGKWNNDDKRHTSINNPQYHIFTSTPCNSIISIETLSDVVKVTKEDDMKRKITKIKKFSSSPPSSPNDNEKERFQFLRTPSSVGLLLEKRVSDNANETLGKKRFQIGLPNNRIENGLRFSKYINQSYLCVSLECTLLDNNVIHEDDEETYYSSDDDDKEDVPYVLVPVAMAQTNQHTTKCSNKYVMSIYSSEPLTVKELRNPNYGGYKYYLTVNGVVGKKIGKSGRLLSPLKISMKSRNSGSSSSNNNNNIRNIVDPAEYGGSYPKYKSWWLNPQYMFEVSNGNHDANDGSKTEVLIALHNKTDVTRRGRSNSNAIPTWPSIGFLIVKCENSHIIRFLPSKIYVDSAKCDHVPTILKTLFLENGKYILIPFGKDPSIAFEFTLNVYCDNSLSTKNLVLLKDWDSHICWKSNWVKYFCGGCCNNRGTWLQNPTATFEIFMKEDMDEDDESDAINNEEEEESSFHEINKVEKTCTVQIEILGKHLSETPHGFFLYSGLPPYNPKKYDGDDPKFIGQPWIQNRFSGKLKSGSYTIVAQTFKPNILGNFIVHMYSDDGVLIPGRCIGRNGGAGGKWIVNERKHDVCI